MSRFARSDLADLNVFLTIVRCGGFRQAAVDLGLTTSAVSHAMRRLESRVGVRLLHRTSRSAALTAAGQDLAQALRLGFDAIHDGLSALAGHRTGPSGRLRLNVPRDAARLLLAPIWEDFFARFPLIHLDIAVEDRLVDIVEEGFDAGIRFMERVPKDMIAVPLTEPLRWVIAASPGYLERHGRPVKPQDLHDHRCIQMRIGDHSTYPWELGNGDSMLRIEGPGPLRVNDTDTAVDAAKRGIGLVYCLERCIETELGAGVLEIVLPEWTSMGAPYAIYYSSRRHLPPGLRELTRVIRETQKL
ncbi:LysR family transcriptional regulator [Gluconacetobacter azotocaptans]|uniref:LysR family transcriptional regulator n=1 Tax=Gluconacetobacter azotocaptans TaxID=142834 RepID=A0A7W4JP72_9PROT|nr:LysR family transcriptional regulator [Gluconacetobacter azotocaptans]MBB2188376.1 LysR family transcriptional regulator [Gluconacetobacter azotocaptans]